MKYKVLCTRAPQWKVGERELDAVARREKSVPVAIADAERYPDDYAGKVISIIPAEKMFHPADIAEPSRVILAMELSDDERDVLRSRTRKIGADRRAEHVSFEDRWGAIAAVLRANFDDAEAAESEQVSKTSYDGYRFRQLSSFAGSSLVEVEVHSGAGLYEVGPAKTYATIQSALDQLWTDQGSAVFAEIQYIRVFADTYDESDIAPNGGLEPRWAWPLVVEGDSADSRDNILLQPSGGTRGILLTNDGPTIIRHMTWDCDAVSTITMQGSGVSDYWEISDCVITGTNNHVIFHASISSLIRDCVITSTGRNAIVSVASDSTNVIERCLIQQIGARGSTIGIDITHGIIEACIINGFFEALQLTSRTRDTRVRHNTIYDCTRALTIDGYPPGIALWNNIISNVTTIIRIGRAAMWPDESGQAAIGNAFTLRNNVYHSYTTFADDTVLQQTYAQFVAMDRVDAASDLDATDPLFTTPGSDFSLQATSPCLNAGHGSGTVSDYAGTAYHPQTPDIGAVSTGATGVVPAWGSNTSNVAATDVEDGDGVSIIFDAATLAPSQLTTEYAVQRQAAGGDWSAGTIVWIGAGTSVTLGGLTQDTAYDFRVGVRTTDLGQSWSYSADDDEATPTGEGPPSIPNAPAISAIVNDGDGDGATVSLETDTSSDVYLYSRIRNSIDAWAFKGSRTDSGDIASSGHTNNSNYEFIAIATFGVAVNEDPSLPSIPATVYITDAAGFYSVIMQALYDWVDGELGIPVIWQHPNAPQPAKEYVTIDMKWTQGPQWDFKSPPDSVNGISTIRGDREFIVSLQLQGKRLPENENTGMTLAEQLATSLQKESIIAAFNAAGCAFVDRVAMTDLSALGGTEFESRASLELLFRMGHETTDTVGVIETVDTVEGAFE